LLQAAANAAQDKNSYPARVEPFNAATSTICSSAGQQQLLLPWLA
jgi:hypothetical protein